LIGCPRQAESHGGGADRGGEREKRGKRWAPGFVYSLRRARRCRRRRRRRVRRRHRRECARARGGRNAAGRSKSSWTFGKASQKRRVTPGGGARPPAAGASIFFRTPSMSAGLGAWHSIPPSRPLLLHSPLPSQPHLARYTTRYRSRSVITHAPHALHEAPSSPLLPQIQPTRQSIFIHPSPQPRFSRP
jgi:hypothetical protein